MPKETSTRQMKFLSSSHASLLALRDPSAYEDLERIFLLLRCPQRIMCSPLRNELLVSEQNIFRPFLR